MVILPSLLAVREDRSPGGKHRIKRPRPDDVGIVDVNKKMEDIHLELIEKLMEAGPERTPSSQTIGNANRMRKPISSVFCDQLRLKPTYSGTEAN